MPPKIHYTSTSKEEYSELEKDMKRFLEGYSIFPEGDIGVRRGHNNCVRISPLQGIIKEVSPTQLKKERAPKAELERLSPEYKFAIMKLDDVIYQINFDDTVTT
ncbi:hypothetical protein HOE04_00795 [archaeon]|jgi:hypothetical protein|nr:hypothetical protein [archaeon]